MHLRSWNAFKCRKRLYSTNDRLISIGGIWGKQHSDGSFICLWKRANWFFKILIFISCVDLNHCAEKMECFPWKRVKRVGIYYCSEGQYLLSRNSQIFLWTILNWISTYRISCLYWNMIIEMTKIPFNFCHKIHNSIIKKKTKKKQIFLLFCALFVDIAQYLRYLQINSFLINDKKNDHSTWFSSTSRRKHYRRWRPRFA